MSDKNIYVPNLGDHRILSAFIMAILTGAVK